MSKGTLILQRLAAVNYEIRYKKRNVNYQFHVARLNMVIYIILTPSLPDSLAMRVPCSSPFKNFMKTLRLMVMISLV